MRSFFISLCLIGVGLSACTPKYQAKGKEESGYQKVWSDEFDYQGLPDSAKWTYDVGDGCPDICGWGNNELQYYTEKRLANARVGDGSLIIEARREYFNGKGYTSARLLTRGKVSWRYGRFEIRANLPSGIGTWPAIWMLPEDWQYGGWPASGEIDIMEHVGYDSLRIHGSIHTAAYNHIEGTQKTGTVDIPDAERAFHIYAVEWTPEKITWFVDNKPYYSFSNEHATFREWPFDQPFHLILNIAIGGNWGGAEGVDENIWPQQMVIDYVRVYRKNS